MTLKPKKSQRFLFSKKYFLKNTPQIKNIVVVCRKRSYKKFSQQGAT